MTGPLHDLLARDHERLDALLAAALRDDGSIDEPSYAEFRRGLLRHIGIEEKLLFRALRIAGAATAVEDQLHRDHAALAALLVPRPSRDGIEQIRAILVSHNPLEEDSGGMYDRVQQLPDLQALLSSVRDYPEVPTAPYADSPALRRSIESLLRQRS